MGKPGVGLQVISHISVLYNKVRSSCGIFNMCLCCLFKKKICNSGYFPACQKFSTFWPICVTGFFLKPMLNLPSCLLFPILFAMNKGKSSFNFYFLQVFDLNYFCNFLSFLD